MKTALTFTLALLTILPAYSVTKLECHEEFQDAYVQKSIDTMVELRDFTQKRDNMIQNMVAPAGYGPKGGIMHNAKIDLANSRGQGAKILGNKADDLIGAIKELEYCLKYAE